MSPYSIKADPKTMAKAYGKEMNISPKHAVELCRFLRGRRVPLAEKLLKKVIKKTVAVPFKRYKHSVSHRRGKIGPGKYPVKAAEHILKLIEDVKSNAEFKGIDPESTVIKHISAYKGRPTESWFHRARGRTTPKVLDTVNVEIIIEEREGKE